jgi:transcriptional regulator with PAS, ATPase and Fis domain
MNKYPNATTKELVERAIAACQLDGISLHEGLDIFRKEWIRALLARTGNNRSAAAAREGVHRNTLSRIMNRVNLQVPRNWTARH